MNMSHSCYKGWLEKRKRRKVKEKRGEAQKRLAAQKSQGFESGKGKT